MRLLTHNILHCNVKQCNGYPLRICAVEVENAEGESDLRTEFLKVMLGRINWTALVSAAVDIGKELPISIPSELSEDFLRKLQTILLEVRIAQGNLICPLCSREFCIKDGILNMLPQEDEV